MAAGGGGKKLLGGILVVIGAMILTGLDRRLEAAILDFQPDWVIEWSSKFVAPFRFEQRNAVSEAVAAAHRHSGWLRRRAQQKEMED